VLWQWIGGRQSTCFLKQATVTVKRFKRYANGIGGGATWKKVRRRQIEGDIPQLEVL
jgi:hypothetical protein